ncbi:uncharacterized protein KY384_004079 [Bacidia gigantensis]|uniref:uncharacterized protein n=1 Tax=Bacidia gigantensis TaxID=2732470 RepID=UPI001D049244|nr:uncharacterized protein KY384_004079 [Bacidia gigantensis]KAG8530722.1 hypothetical protein KY384_004079 [Bacidia gigantensis]
MNAPPIIALTSFASNPHPHPPITHNVHPHRHHYYRPRRPLTTTLLQTPTPLDNEVLINNLYTASTPLDLHQADGGLLVTHPQVLGDGVAGRVVAVGPTATRLKVGDYVFGFTWRTQKEKAFQDLVCAPEFLVARVVDAGVEEGNGEGQGKGEVQEGINERLKALVTVPNNFVSAWHALVTDLGIALSWPIPKFDENEDRTKTILVWGGSGSVGQYALQILRAYGYQNVYATASKRNAELVRECGAKGVFDYSDPHVVEAIVKELGTVDLVLDCIGHLSGTLAPISRIAKAGARVAVMLPVIVRDAAEGVKPEFAMDPSSVVRWEEGVEVRDVRTHFYLENAMHREMLQPVIMPELVRRGIVKPNRQRVVEGRTMVERAEKALGLLRGKGLSGERAVWKVSDVEARDLGWDGEVDER